jgi:prephenate dehydrogenase
LLNNRMHITDAIADWKMQEDVGIEDSRREEAVIAHAQNEAAHFVLREMIENIYASIIACSKASQALRLEPKCPFVNIGIIGLGLIGGSIAKAIKSKQNGVGVCTLAFDSADIAKAQLNNAVDVVYGTMDELCAHVELIILAVPPKAVLPLAEEIFSHAEQFNKLVICDVAGVKGRIVSAFERLSESRIEYVATHPMAGSENSGFDNSSAVLFANASWIVSPHQRNTAENLSKIGQLIEFLGARPSHIEAAKHDRQVAYVSHFPGLLSELLLQFVIDNDPQSISISGPGFKSMTRMAYDNRELRKEIIAENRTLISSCLNRWSDYVQQHKGQL